MPSIDQYEEGEQENDVENVLESQVGEETLYPGLSETSKRLLGLKEFRKFSAEEERNTFSSSDRMNAYLNLSTNTFPIDHKINYKKGIVRDIVSKDLIDENILKNNLTVYLGSGTDIEYPLAFGARNIWLVDPELNNNEAILELRERIEKITEERLSLEIQESFRFDFDFGNGKEEVMVDIVPKKYGIDGIHFPENIGLVILFASQDMNRQVCIGEDIRNNIIEGGYILNESDLEKVNNNIEGDGSLTRLL
ncbi:MAG: hypothetical protein PHW52_04795 [Candidatus Pacebacteria bacterium]|nr:hypothetical protein [Candidatus Paceibacterota bacterium]